MTSRHTTGVLLTILSSCFFGLLGLFNSLAQAGGLGVLQRIALRFLVSSLLLFLYLKHTGKEMGVPKGTGLRLFFSSAIMFGGTGFLLFSSYRYIPTSMATILHFIYPLLVLSGTILLDGIRPSRLQKAGTVCSLAGLVVALNSDQGFTDANRLGVLLALSSAVTFFLYIRFLASSETKETDNTVLMFQVLLFAGMFWSVPAIAGTARDGLAPIGLPMAIGGIAGLSVISSVLACTFFSAGVRIIGPDKASILSVFEPLTAIVAGVVLLGERLPKNFWPGALLIVVGSFLVSKSGETEFRMQTIN